MLVNFSVAPLGTGPSMSKLVAKAIDLIDRSGLDYRTHSMGTVVEGNWDDVMGLVRQCHELMLEGAERVYTTMTIDDRKGAKDRLEGKVSSIEETLGRQVKK